MEVKTPQEAKLAGQLAIQAAEAGIGRFLAKLRAAFKAKNITLSKVLRMYEVVNRAVKEVEAILAEK